MNWIETINKEELLNLSNGEERQKSFTSFVKEGIPTRKNEAWKYTDLKKFIDFDWNFNSTEENKTIEIPNKIGENTTQLVFVNGFFSKLYSDDLPSFITLVSETENKPVNFGKIINDAPLVNLNKALYKDGLIFSIKKSLLIENRIEIVYINTNENQFINLRNFVEVSENASLKITERHFNYSNTKNFTNILTECTVDKSGRLDICKIQNDTIDSSLIDHTIIEQEEKSYAQVDTFAFNGKLVRNNLQFIHKGEYLESHLRAITIADNGSHVDHSTLVDHCKPNGFSNQLYKAIYSDKAKGVFNGRIMVHQDAQKTNAFQQNNNILFDKTASIDTKPQLEIFADDVKCSHGCTIGELDEKGLFYMQQRGIPLKEAKALMTYAFANEALGNIKDLYLLDFIKKMIANKLNVDMDL